MKTFMTALAVTGLTLTAIASTPAMAQYTPGSQAMAASHQSMSSGSAAFAYAPQAGGHMNSVYVNGEYRGTDPDSAIRLQLQSSVPSSEF